MKASEARQLVKQAPFKMQQEYLDRIYNYIKEAAESGETSFQCRDENNLVPILTANGFNVETLTIENTPVLRISWNE